MDSMAAPSLPDSQTELLSELRHATLKMLQEQETLVKDYLARLPAPRASAEQDEAARDGQAGTQPPAVAPKPAEVSPRAQDEREPEPETGKSRAQYRQYQASGTKILTGVSTDWVCELVHPEEDMSAYNKVQRLLDWWKKLEEPARSGPLARVVLNSKFEMLTLMMVMLNGIIIIWQTETDARIVAETPHVLVDVSSAARWYTVVETLLLVFFAVELILKLLVHRFFFFCNADMYWNIFDTVTVLSAVLDLVINFIISEAGGSNDVSFLRVLRVLRLTRSLRTMRALQFVKSLRQLMRCIVESFSALFWCMMLLMFLTILFAVFLVQVSTNFLSELELTGEMPLDPEKKDELVANLGTLQSATVSLLKCTTGGNDWGYYYDLLLPTGVFGPGVLMAYVLFFIVAAWNIVTSMFLERAMALAQPDIEEVMLQKRRQAMLDAKDLMDLIQAIDSDDSGTISLNEFKAWMQDPTLRGFLEVRNIDIKDTELFFHMLKAAAGCEDVDLSLVVHGLMRMRGIASCLDIHMLNFQNMLFFNSMYKWTRTVKTDLLHVASEVSIASRARGLSCISESSEASSPTTQGKALAAVQDDIAKLNFTDVAKAIGAASLTGSPLDSKAGDGSALASKSLPTASMASGADSAPDPGGRPSYRRHAPSKLSSTD